MPYRFEDRIIKPSKYTPSERTNVAATIRRAYRKIKAAKLAHAPNVRPMRSKVAA